MPKCPVRFQIELPDAVAKTVKRVYLAKAECAKAQAEKRKVAAYAAALAVDRKDELLAVKPLDSHKQEHGCGKPPFVKLGPKPKATRPKEEQGKH